MKIKTKYKQTKICELVEQTVGGTWGPESDETKGIPVLRSTNFTKDQKIVFENIAYRDITDAKLTNRILKNGDILIEISGGGPSQPVGRALEFINPDGKTYTYGNFVRRLKLNSDLLTQEYLSLALKALYIFGETEPIQTNTTNLRNLNFKDYINLEIPVPTIQEQKQIVSKIKECFTLLDKSEEKLKQATEKSNKVAESFLHRAYVKNIANYRSCSLKDACTRITDGSHFSPKTIPSGYPYITVRDIDEVGIDFQNCKMISKESYNDLVKLGCKPEYGDVLFSKDGTVGKVAKVPNNKDFVVLSSLAIITPNKEILSTDFLELLLNTPEVLNQAIKKKTGTAIRRITLTNLKEITIPIPPLRIQNDIYTEYLKYQMIGKKNMSFLIRSRDRLELLRQSILKKAFEGKLI